MLQSVEELYGKKLVATDGLIGHVKDFYFDDKHWAIRYLVVDTGAWLPGRMVLLSPHAFNSRKQPERLLFANLTRKQIEDSPSIELHKPVSRQYEEEYYQYYGWPSYWQGDAMWGMSALPVFEMPVKPHAGEPGVTSDGPARRAAAHLRSTKAVYGYQIQARDGNAGQVHDFMMNTVNWAISELVVKIGHWLSGREVQIATSAVKKISYEESTMYVSLSKQEVERIPSQESLFESSNQISD